MASVFLLDLIFVLNPVLMDGVEEVINLGRFSLKFCNK